MKKIFLRLIDWWQNRKKVKKYSNTVFASSILDVPKNIGRKVYIIEKEETKKWVVFLCPCSKKNRVEVNLMKTRKPHWELSISDGKVTLSPSVVVTGKCSCHFWLKKSKAYIC